MQVRQFLLEHLALSRGRESVNTSERDFLLINNLCPLFESTQRKLQILNNQYYYCITLTLAVVLRSTQIYYPSRHFVILLSSSNRTSAVAWLSPICSTQVITSNPPIEFHYLLGQYSQFSKFLVILQSQVVPEKSEMSSGHVQILYTSLIHS